MTIICVKDGVAAADSGSFVARLIVSTTTEKLVRSPDGAIAGAAGPSCVCDQFRQWFSRSTPDMRKADGVNVFRPEVKDGSDFAAVWLEPDGVIWHIEYTGSAFTLNEAAAAIGSSEEFALGLMAAGKSAAEAVAICIERTAYAAGEVRVEALSKVPVAEVEQPSLFDFPEPPDLKMNYHVIPGIDREWREKMGLDARGEV